VETFHSKIYNDVRSVKRNKAGNTTQKKTTNTSRGSTNVYIPFTFNIGRLTTKILTTLNKPKIDKNKIILNTAWVF